MASKVDVLDGVDDVLDGVSKKAANSSSIPCCQAVCAWTTSGAAVATQLRDTQQRTPGHPTASNSGLFQSDCPQSCLFVPSLAFSTSLFHFELNRPLEQVAEGAERLLTGAIKVDVLDGVKVDVLDGVLNGVDWMASIREPRIRSRSPAARRSALGSHLGRRSLRGGVARPQYPRRNRNRRRRRLQ